jgi:hypothetical protein
MIRMNPAHDTKNPPGSSVPKEQENVQYQDKPLGKEIDEYQRGFADGIAYATVQKLSKYDPFVLGEYGR